jgi:monoamine oxidase
MACTGGDVGSLSGTHVVIAGGGLAGLSAAYALGRLGAAVHVFEAQERLGGRVWTLRNEAGQFHIEAGGEFIDAEQHEIRELAAALRVRLIRILRRGFGLALSVDDRVRVSATQERAWKAMARRLDPAIKALKSVGCNWNTATAAVIARLSFAEALERGRSNDRVTALSNALRCFYLADPEALSALVVVEQAASDAVPGRSTMYRAKEGNDALIDSLAKRIRGRVSLTSIVRAIRQDGNGVRVTIEDRHGRSTQTTADYVVVALPSSLVLECVFDPPLPSYQQAALASLGSGAATKVALRFERKWWRLKSRPWAYGTNLAIGAVWDGAEAQPHANVLTFLAGGSGSAELRNVLEVEGPSGIVSRLSWMGSPTNATLVADPVSWEDEPWSRGGYAVFPPTFDPRLRVALAASHGRIVFAGEHTSRRWQGFMNGAVESGQRAAREIETLERLR